MARSARKLRAVAVAAPAMAALSFASACIVATSEEPPLRTVGQGVLVVDWSIDGSQDPALCNVSAADSISIVVSTRQGDFVGEFAQDCEAMGTSIELFPGDYLADAVLVDATGAERTTPVDIGAFRIYGDDQLDIAVDFPAHSFY